MQDRELMQAASCLPPPLRTQIQRWAEQHKECCEEIRLRTGRPLTVATLHEEQSVGGRTLTQQVLQDTVDRACEYSVHTFASNISQGFLTLPGGHRVGVCGEAVWEQGRIVSFRSFSSLNIRVARAISGAAPPEMVQAVQGKQYLRSALIFSPPKFGKTTLLRDLTRQLSERGFRMGLADERGELAAVHRGQPQLAIGPCSDVITGCPKAEAALMLVKTMSPDAIVLDEITTERDIQAALHCSHCGTAVFATAHAYSMEDFHSRPLYQQLLQSNIFPLFFELQRDRTIKTVMKN